MESTTKIISKIMVVRVSTLLPKMISNNQSGFIKGRLITENIMLAQEIIQSVSKENRGGNIVIKLDMAKAYDRLSWTFLTSVLRKIGFAKHWIDIIWRLISDVWYSSVINGSRKGFFTYSQGIKLFHHLFIIVAEVLSRSLNQLQHNPNFTPFYMNHRSPQINHLVYADDIVIFSGGNNKSVRLIMK